MINLPFSILLNTGKYSSLFNFDHFHPPTLVCEFQTGRKIFVVLLNRKATFWAILRWNEIVWRCTKAKIPVGNNPVFSITIMLLKKWIWYFSADRGINQKSCSALLQMFSVMFTVDTLINGKYIRHISYHLIFIAFQETKIQSNPFKCRIFYFWRCRDKYNVTIIFFGWCNF